MVRVIGTHLPEEVATSSVTEPTAVMGKRSLFATETVLNGGSRSVMVVSSDIEGTMCLVQPPSIIQAVDSVETMNRADS